MEKKYKIGDKVMVLNELNEERTVKGIQKINQYFSFLYSTPATTLYVLDNYKAYTEVEIAPYDEATVALGKRVSALEEKKK